MGAEEQQVGAYHPDDHDSLDCPGFRVRTLGAEAVMSRPSFTILLAPAPQSAEMPGRTAAHAHAGESPEQVGLSAARATGTHMSVRRTAAAHDARRGAGCAPQLAITDEAADGDVRGRTVETHRASDILALLRACVPRPGPDRADHLDDLGLAHAAGSGDALGPNHGDGTGRARVTALRHLALAACWRRC